MPCDTVIKNVTKELLKLPILNAKQNKAVKIYIYILNIIETQEMIFMYKYITY